VLNILQRISALGFYLIYEINGYIIGWGASIVIMVIIGLYLLRDYLFVSSGITPFRHVFGIALPYYLASYARYFFTQFDQLLIGFYFSPDILALYYICRRFTDFIWQIFQNTLDPLCAKIAELKINYLHKVSSAIQMSLTILSYVFVPIGMGLAASSYFALQLVTGGKYTVGYPILALLALSLIFYGYFNFFTLHVYILDQPKKRLYLEAILGGTQLIASCIGVYFGVIGIPLSLIISYTIGSLVAFWWVQRIIPFTVEYKNILKILLFGLIMAALLIFLQKIWYNTFIVPLYIVLVGAFFVVTSFKFLSKAEWEFVRNIIPEKIVRLLPIKRHL
jgi:O-antigen/teichoic acid export membrane protein